MEHSNTPQTICLRSQANITENTLHSERHAQYSVPVLQATDMNANNEGTNRQSSKILIIYYQKYSLYNLLDLGPALNMSIATGRVTGKKLLNSRVSDH